MNPYSFEICTQGFDLRIYLGIMQDKFVSRSLRC